MQIGQRIAKSQKLKPINTPTHTPTQNIIINVNTTSPAAVAGR